MKDFNLLPDKKIVHKTAVALREKGYQTFLFEKGDQALEKIKELIPDGNSVMRGSSVTLEQIGFAQLLKSGKHHWTDLHELVHQENDPEKRAELRKKTAFSDFYLGSVHALTENGEFLVASNTGSQLPHIAFTSPNLIFVISTKKIVKDLIEGFVRLEKYVFHLEDERMKKVHGIGTGLNKVVVFKGENPRLKRKINILLVNELIGY